MNLAGYKARVFAKIIDILFFIVLYLLNAIVAYLFALLFLLGLPYLGFYRVHNYVFFIQVINWVVQFLSVVIYLSCFVAKYDGTVGKKVFRIKLVTTQGDKLTPYRAIGRFAAELLSAALFGLGYIMALFDPEKRTLHDRICSTRVVKVEKGEKSGGK